MRRLVLLLVVVAGCDRRIEIHATPNITRVTATASTSGCEVSITRQGVEQVLVPVMLPMPLPYVPVTAEKPL